MKLYYSCDFKESIITHHGDTEYPLNVFQNSEPYIESMTAFVKSALTKSLKKWGFTPENLKKVDFYFYRGSEEIIFLVGRKKPQTTKRLKTSEDMFLNNAIQFKTIM